MLNSLPALEDLRLFCTVVRNSSFVVSAAELGVSPAYVSKRIAALEGMLHVSLLYRTTRKVRLTSDGETVYRWSQRMLEETGLMVEAISTAKSVPQGALRISASSGFGRKYVAPVLSEVALLYPALQIQLELFSRPVDIIGEGFDVDINFGVVPDSRLLVKNLAANQRILCAAPQYVQRMGAPQTIEELASHKCIAIRERNESFGVWRLDSGRGVESVKVTGPLSCNNGEIVLRWALDGHGIILRSQWDVESALAEGRLVRILPEYSQQADISAVYPVRLADSAKVRVFVQHLSDSLARVLHAQG